MIQRRSICALVCALALAISALGSPQAARAESAGEEFGVGAATVFTNLFYSPAKLFWASMGGMVGGMAWMFTGGDSDVAIPIWEASFRGTYALTPEHLRGKREIEFIGRTEEHQRARRAADDAGGYSEGF